MVPTLPSKHFIPSLAQHLGRSVTARWIRWSFSLLLLQIMGISPTAVQATSCANAIVINPASVPITGQALVCGAGNDLNSTTVPGAICGSSSSDYYKGGNEALYSFTPTTTAAYQLSYTGQTWSAAMVYIGCPTLNNCLYGSGQTGSSVSFAVTLNAGTTYFIWFDTWPSPASPCPGTFSLTPPPPPITNDEPCQATSLTVNTSLLCSTQTPGSLVGATATTSVPTAPCGGTPNDDVWFSFVATATTHYVNLNNVAGTPTDLYHAVYRGTCGALVNIGCSDPDNSTVTGLVVGSTYWVRVYSYFSNAGPTTTFNVCIASPPPPITNDNPCQALALTVNSNLLCGTQTPGSLIGATATAGITLAPCFGTPNNDVWFSFVATGPTHNISLNNVSGNPTDLYHAVYRGTCGSLINISCSDPDASVVSGLVAGTTYWLRVYSYSSSAGATSTFNVCIGSPPPAPTCGQMFYDPGGPSADYSNNANSTVTICPTIAGQVVSLVFSQFDLENNWDNLRIYNGTSAAAPLLGTYTGTTLPTSITATNSSGCLTAVFTSDGSGVRPGWAAQVNCGPPPPAPGNDNPCGATSLTVNPNLLCGSQTPGTLVMATATSTVPTAPCYGTPNDDVWFSFVATGPTHHINLNNIAGNTSDLYHAVYSGNCSSLTNISCSDPESSVVSGLITGNTYWVRVYSYSSNAGASTTFNVCIGSPPHLLAAARYSTTMGDQVAPIFRTPTRPPRSAPPLRGIWSVWCSPNSLWKRTGIICACTMATRPLAR